MMKLGIPDIDKTVAQAVTPFLQRLDAMQGVLEEIRDLLRAQQGEK